MKNNLYVPSSRNPFRLSRSKVDLFLQCPRCFYLDRMLGISQPAGAPFTLNNAVDALLKKEFDGYRETGTIHPFIEQKGIQALPFSHPDIENWRNNRQGIQFFHPSLNFLLYGAIDDVWQFSSNELIIVDYKAKATTGEITLEPKRKKNGEIVKTDRYLLAYKRQIEFYQWLFRKNGFKVSKISYFLFANALKDRSEFGDQLQFEKTLIAYEGDDSWVEPAIEAIAKCLNSTELPDSANDCDYCQYRMRAQLFEKSTKKRAE